METYCSALLNQEKSLEELQRHLRSTEVGADSRLSLALACVSLLRAPVSLAGDLHECSAWPHRPSKLPSAVNTI